MTRAWTLAYSVTCLSVAAVVASLVPASAYVMVVATPPPVTTIHDTAPPPAPPVRPSSIDEDEELPARPWEARVPTLVAGLPTIVDVVAYGTRTCALAAEGTVYCWGATSGATGSEVSVPTRLTNVAGVTQIAATSERMCALIRGGRLHCDPPSPAEPDLEGVRAVFGGARDLCAAMLDGSVRCTGEFVRAYMEPEGAAEEPSEFQRIPRLEGAKEIVFGAQMFARVADGSIRWWGPTNACWGTPQTSAAFFPLRNVQRLLDGDCAGLKDGSVRCWGRDGGGAPTLTPGKYDEPHPRLPLADVRQIAVSALAAPNPPRCAVTGDGVVHCWGQNQAGMFGDRSFSSADAPMPIVAWGRVKRIALGDQHACAVRESGEVVCAGSNAHGQLGVGSVVDDD